MKSIRNRLSTGCIFLGTALLAAALGLFIRNQGQAKLAGETADAALLAVREAIREKQSGSGVGESGNPAFYDTQASEEDEYAGYLTIPALGLELPVMADWDYPRLKVSPCRYYGSPQTEDMVIAAHNYPRHFGRLSKLEKGDEIIFTDMDGIEWHYKVIVTDVLSPIAVEEMTEAGYDLTLFTCTYGGASRVTVRCERTET